MEAWDDAERYYHRALSLGFYPGAYVGLSKCSHHHGQTEQEISHLLASLNLTRELGPDADSPLLQLEGVCGSLMALRTPIPGCRAWIVHLDFETHSTRGRLSLLIAAENREEAEAQVREIVEALLPDRSFTPNQLDWEANDAPQGAIRPGIYRIQFRPEDAVSVVDETYGERLGI